MLTALLLHTALAGAALAQAPAAVDASDTSGTSEPAVLDAELEPYRAELLELAHRMAIALPEFPHVKDRSRLQDDVAAACFALDQPRRALGYVDQIVNWRRGAGYADYAFYCAQRGAEAEAEQYLARAQEIAAWPEDEIKQAWRRDRIRAKIARTYTVLGRPAEAARFAAGLETSEWGQVEAVEAATVPDDEFDAWFRRVERAVDTENFVVVLK